MNDVLKIFLSMSLSGTLLILVLSLCKPIIKDRLSRQWQYYIWLIVMIRLLLPYAPESNLMGKLFSAIDNAVYQVRFLQTQEQTHPGLQDGNQKTALLTEHPQAITFIQEPVQDILALFSANIWLIWLIAALILLVRKITVYQSFMSYMKAGQIPISNTRLLDLLALTGEQAGINKSIELCVNPLVSSPLLIGFLNPCIILPDVNLSERDFCYTVLHELTHYKRRDMLYKWLVQITLCLHWFNPFVYYMCREISKACEFSCDEAIAAKLNSNSLKDYGETLLNAMAKTGNYMESIATVTLSENKELLKERLKSIMKYKKKSKLVTAGTLLLTVILCSGAVSAGAYAAPLKNTDCEKPVLSRSESLIQCMAPFQIYGLTYEADEDELYYNGQSVRAFVDLREAQEDGTYSFNVGYFDDDSDKGLYLETTHNKKGNVTGIVTMSEALKNDLYEGADNELPSYPEIDSEIMESMNRRTGTENQYSGYVVFDATATYLNKTITATDQFESSDIPQEISDWTLECRGTDTVNIKRTSENGNIDTWVYYDSADRLGWSMDVSDSGIILNFMDFKAETISGPTMIHYSAPDTYKGLDVFYNNQELMVDEQ